MASAEMFTGQQASCSEAEMTIKQLLDLLGDRNSKHDLLAAPYDAHIAETENEKSLATADLNREIARIRKQIRELVLDYGTSVRATWLHAVYAKGCTTWDSKLLKGYASAHPDVLQMRKVGKPSVSIRKVR